MTVFVYSAFYIICALNILWGIRKKKSNALYSVAFCLVFFLMTFNYNGNDIDVYMAEYETVSNSANPLQSVYMEWGYTLITVICGKMGLDFFAFRAILSIVILSLFSNTIKYYKAQGNLVIGVYMLYLFIFDTIQLRNCVVQFIVLFATRYLLQKSNLSTLKFLICIAIAASIHTIAVVYVSLVLIKLFRKKSFYKRFFIFAMAMFGMLIVMQPFLPQLGVFISKFLPRGIGYLSGTVKYGWIIVFLLYIIGLITLHSCKTRVTDNNARAIIETAIKVNIILGLFLPLTLFNNNFNRIFRNNIIFTLIALTLIYKRSASADHRKLALCVFAAINVGWIYSDMFARYEISALVNPIFESNLILNGMASSNIMTYIFVTLISIVIIKILKDIVSPKKSVKRRTEYRVKRKMGDLPDDSNCVAGSI